MTVAGDAVNQENAYTGSSVVRGEKKRADSECQRNGLVKTVRSKEGGNVYDPVRIRDSKVPRVIRSLMGTRGSSTSGAR